MQLKLKEKAFGVTLSLAGFFLNPIWRISMKKMHIRREIAKDVLISADWTVFKPQPPMKIKKHFQEISLVLENCQQNASKNRANLIFSDGTVINPAKQIIVEIFDEDGIKYTLKSGRYSVGNYDEEKGRFSVSAAGFGSLKIALPRNKSFNEIRIFSEKPFHCKKIIWHDYIVK